MASQKIDRLSTAAHLAPAHFGAQVVAELPGVTLSGCCVWRLWISFRSSPLPFRQLAGFGFGDG
jgi:hypothetical protein